MKILSISFFILTLIIPFECIAGNLVISHKLQISFPEPEKIGHDKRLLTVVYSDWKFTHQIVDPKEIYQGIDLDGMEVKYIKSIFVPKTREELPAWLAVLAAEQAQAFGVTDSNVKRQSIGETELISIYDTQKNEGFIYVFDELVTHQLTVLGSKEKHNFVVKQIKER